MSQKHTVDERTNEALSAFADGEVPERDLSHWIATLATDGQARARFSRYRLIGAQLAGEEDRVIDASSVAGAVSQRLRDEPTVLAPRRARGHAQLPRLALGAALAAGIAAMAVSVAPRLIGNTAPMLQAEAPSFAFAPRLSVPADGITMVSLTSGIQRPEVVRHAFPASGQRWKVLSPAMQRKLSRYLLEHNEVAGQISAKQPSAHLNYIISYDQQP